MKKIIFSLASLVLVSASFTSCTEDNLLPKVVDKVDITTNPITTVSGLRMAVNGAYKAMSKYAYYGRDYVIYNEVHSDNAYSNGNSGRFLNEAEFKTLLTSSYPAETWNTMYQVVAMANIAINANITSGDQTEIDAIKAEAYALRALVHFDLMKLYGQQNVTRSTSSLTIPYVTQYGTITAENTTRLTLVELKDKLGEDIEAAISLASTNITNKTSINKQAILGLKARIALYLAPFFGDAEYATALSASEEAIALGGRVIGANEYVTSFAAGDTDVNSVFEIQFLSNDNLGVNSLYQIFGDTPYGDVFAAKNVKETLFADANDVRGTMISLDESNVLRNQGKYINRADNVKVMRFEELVLTAAEAAFRTGNSDRALELVNTIASNRGINAYTSIDLNTILLERRKELIFEGFRFDDLMRTQQDIPAIEERSAANTPAYGDNRLAFPIPQSETNVSPIQQNQGY